MPVRDDFELDIVHDIGLAVFYPNRLDELKQYCIDHPGYHIMSILPSVIKINRPVPGARFYLLAIGDADPDLWYCDSACQESQRYSEVREFNHD